MTRTATIHVGDALEVLRTMPDESVHCVVTSPPYWGLRNYGVDGQIGLEPTLDEFLSRLVAVFAEVRRVLRSDGTCWVNMGDAYAANRSYQVPDSKHRDVGNSSPMAVPVGLKPKDLIGQPWRLAFALQDAGWWLRSEVIWCKPNAMPESAKDRPTKSHEQVFLLTKAPRYVYDAHAVREDSVTGDPRRPYTSEGAWQIDGRSDRPGGRVRSGGDFSRRNARTVWTIATQPFSVPEIARLVRVPVGEPSDDTMHIVSPDCPVHGDLPDRVPTRFCGERASDETTRILRRHGRPFEVRLGALVPTGPTRALWTADESSGSWALSCDPSATPRSSRSRKTDLAPATSQPCSSSGGSPDRTGDRSASPAEVDSVAHMPESSIEQGGTGGHLSGGTCARIGDMTSCGCAFYHLETRDVDHFATFPPELPSRCIRAGSSQEGACPECGAPWVRVVEKEFEPTGPRRAHINGESWQEGWEGTPRGITRSTTTGWRPTCDHGATPVPCTVLDPFSGAGTTGLAALRLERNYIGIELNPEYAEMACRRIREDAPLLNRVRVTA